jgi:uncharacterized damage-inducible protein DinB
VLAAAGKLTADQYAGLADQFAHMLGAQRLWYAFWTGGDYGSHAATDTLDLARSAYGQSHEDLRTFAASLTEETLDREEDWFGRNLPCSVAESLVQVVAHSVQHRAEIAVKLTEWDASPGDLDYIRYVWSSAKR